MSLPLTSTCVGGRRAGVDTPFIEPVKEKVAAGTAYTDPGIGGRLWGLTRRETEALEAVITHGRAKVACRALGMSPKTLEVHVQRIRAKSGHSHIAPLVAAYVSAKVRDEGKNQ